MTRTTKIYAGLLLLTMVTIESGGYFLMRILRGDEDVTANSIQFSLFRAGHAHAGVLVILALVAMIYVEHTGYSDKVRHAVRILFIAAPLMMSGGFFLAGGMAQDGKPGPATLLYLGAATLAAALVSLAVGLIRRPVSPTPN